MKKIYIVYDSKFGNTKRVAESIIMGIKKVEGMETTLSSVEDVDENILMNFDGILIGSPNHVGAPTGKIKKFIKKLRKLDLKGKKIAVFDTYMGEDFEKAIRKMEEIIRRKAPDLDLLTPGMSIRVDGMKGPITEGELPKCEDFGQNIADKIGG